MEWGEKWLRGTVTLRGKDRLSSCAAWGEARLLCCAATAYSWGKPALEVPGAPPPSLPPIYL